LDLSQALPVDTGKGLLMIQSIPQFASRANGHPQPGTPGLAQPPVAGMVEIPFGLPQMASAWVGCVSWALSVPDLRERFKVETGHSLDAIAEASGLDQLIDGATGRTRDGLVAWCDWVTVNVWSPATQFEEIKEPDSSP
jgi:hypothetical protein